jgi:hypothetical protein
MDDVASAVPQLREPTSDESVLPRTRANVSKTLGGSSSTVLERAAAIVEAVLSPATAEGGDIGHVASCGWPYDSPCVRCYPDFYES